MSKTYVNRTYRYAHFAGAPSWNTVQGPFKARARQESPVPLLVGVSSLVSAVVATLIAVLLTVAASPTAASATCAERPASTVGCAH